jgi:steroid delta-isomerase-like uncharacterized protein
MRNRPIIACLTGVVLCACSEERVGPPPPVPTGSLSPVAVIDAGPDIVSAREKALAGAWADAIMSPGLEKLAPLIDEDAHFLSPDMEDAHYKANVMHGMDALFGAFDNRKVVESRVWRTPSAQTIEWTMTGTQARAWKGVPATNKPVSFQGLTLLWTKDDGSITDIHVYVDIGVVMAQLGAPPAKDFPVVPPANVPTAPAQVFEQSQAGSADEANNVSVARGALDALENNSEVGYLSAFDDAAEVYTQERPQPMRGKDDLKAYFKALRKSVGQLDITVKHAWGVAQFAIVEYTIDGEQLGPIGWIPAQRDTVIRFQIVDVEEIRAGKIVKVWRYDNPMQILPGTPGGPGSP